MGLRWIPTLPMLAGGLLCLAGCVAGPDQLSLQPIAVASLPGWATDHQAADLPPLLRDCERLALLPQDQPLGGDGLTAQLGGRAGDWADACADARQVEPNDAAVREFFERDFAAYQLGNGIRTRARFTGYYEPQFRGSRIRGGVYQTPVYAKPHDLVAGTPYHDRAAIEGGAIAGRGLEIAWLANPVDAFFLQIQGSGRVVLPNGDVIRLGYAGQNGQPYKPIGRILIEQNQLAADQVTAQTIRAWLAAHPDRAKAVMDANPDYVFFRELPDMRAEDGPPGTLKVSLTPGRSIAVDKNFIPLASPIWVDTTDPKDGTAFQRVMQAEDLGGAIKGPLHADIFYGWGADAEERAGKAHQPGRAYVLLPRPRQSAPPAKGSAP